jgi:endonuclease III
MSEHRTIVRALLDRAGTTYAEEAGIRLRDAPAPLYRLLVLSVLLSTRIRGHIAVAAARELVSAGMSTPDKMLAASWQERVDALGRASYKRYDESTATALGKGAELLQQEYRGDLRRLRDRAEGDPKRIREELTAFPRLGPVGADIFCREAQDVWTSLRPAFDRKVRDGARLLGLASDPHELAALAPGKDLAPFTAALVRVTLDRSLADEISRAG